MKDRRQELINNLEQLEQISRSLAHSNIKNIANGDFTSQDADIVLDALKEISKAAAETTLVCISLIRSGQIRPL